VIRQRDLMPYLVDTDVLVDVSRNNQAAIACIDRLGDDWALSAMTALELISGAKNQREVGFVDRLIEVYETIAVNDAIGKSAYDLLKAYAKSSGLRTFDSLIAATAMEQRRTLITRNRKHFEMIYGIGDRYSQVLRGQRWDRRAIERRTALSSIERQAEIMGSSQ
jgi:predicted nucleic acid-binding protein